MYGEKGSPGANAVGPQGIKGFAGIETYVYHTAVFGNCLKGVFIIYIIFTFLYIAKIYF